MSGGAQEEASIETITPAVARILLDTSPGNPRWATGKVVHNRHVQRMARDMKAGRFHLAEAIQVDWDGKLRNGHHRLAAVIEAGIPVRMLVLRGMDPAATAAIDGDRMARSLDQSASAVGRTWITKDVASTVRMMLAGMKTSPARLTRQEQMDFAEEHRAALEFAVSLFGTRRRGISVAPVVAAHARAWYHVSPPSIQATARVLYTGVPRNTGEESVIRLRDFLLTRESGGGAGAAVAYAKTARTIQAVEDGQRLLALHAPATDPFPLPSDDNKETTS